LHALTGYHCHSAAAVVTALLSVAAVTRRMQVIRSRALKFILVLAGYVSMASLAYWV
jgi:hypothetical protein